jgi:Domain of unknown function (DUF4167)
MRLGQHNNNNNKNRNRNRNRRNSGGGGGGQPGGNGANRVYDSNGPDVKLRGTAQTIAEKYMQLARDAQSSGDSVAAESYYQFADHYYRVWLAAQPLGQPIQFSRRNSEEEYDEDGNEIAQDAEGDAPTAEGNDGNESSDAPSNAEAGEGQQDGDNQNYQNRQNNRNYRDNNQNQNQNRDGGNNRNFRQRWPRRNERFNQDGQPVNTNPQDAAPEGGERPERQERPERAERAEPRFERDAEAPAPAPARVEAVEDSNWEAPSFLKRPAPVVAADSDMAEAPVPKPRGRRPRAVVAETPVDDTPVTSGD